MGKGSGLVEDPSSGVAVVGNGGNWIEKGRGESTGVLNLSFLEGGDWKPVGGTVVITSGVE